VYIPSIFAASRKGSRRKGAPFYGNVNGRKFSAEILADVKPRHTSGDRAQQIRGDGSDCARNAIGKHDIVTVSSVDCSYVAQRDIRDVVTSTMVTSIETIPTIGANVPRTKTLPLFPSER